MRFGYNLSTAVEPGVDPAAEAREAESLGYDFVCVSDHLHGTHATHETWTFLTWVAAATSRVQVVPNVLGLPYRAPAVLAKMAESLQCLSDGRLPSVPFAPPEVIPERSAIVLRAAEAAGRSREDLTFVYNVGIAVGPRRPDASLVSGSPEEVAERLAAFADLGFDAVNVWPAGDASEQRHRIAEEVLPMLR